MQSRRVCHNPKRLKERVLCGVTALVAGALLVWAGCTVTPENYKLLSTFFDGVPDPSMSGPSGNMVGFDISQSPTYSIHKPYEEQQCEVCHKVGLQPTRNDSAMCIGCHEKTPSEHRFTHGPVAAGACMWCHAPHESAHAALLRDVDRKVCGQCHTPAMLDSTKVPEHTDESRACLECHTGHGGSAPYMLRPADSGRKGGPDQRPAPQPEK
jgi:predicted CXXCH cytochrome family protein